MLIYADAGRRTAKAKTARGHRQLSGRMGVLSPFPLPAHLDEPPLWSGRVRRPNWTVNSSSSQTRDSGTQLPQVLPQPLPEILVDNAQSGKELARYRALATKRHRLGQDSTFQSIHASGERRIKAQQQFLRPTALPGQCRNQAAATS